MNEQITVSVLCLAYNHEDCISRCLDGIVMQKTDFKFEVLINDDASTDGTAAIIREYEEKYPDIIKPVYQKENQYSKGPSITRTILFPMSQGKYIAFCEGDDYWTDPLKLQKQYDYMECHPECFLCVHKCRVIIENSEETYTVPSISEGREYSTSEIIRAGGGIFATNSTMLRREVLANYPECFNVKGFSDYQMFMFGSICGKCYCLSDVMSVYNSGVSGSWTDRVYNNKEKRIAHNQKLTGMLESIDDYYDKKYHCDIEYALRAAEFDSFIVSENYSEAKKKPYRVFWKRYRKTRILVFLKNKFPWMFKIKRALKSR